MPSPTAIKLLIIPGVTVSDSEAVPAVPDLIASRNAEAGGRRQLR